MGDPDVERWRQRGTIVMWMNRRGSRRGWNIAADNPASDALLDLFDATSRHWDFRQHESMVNAAAHPG